MSLLDILMIHKTETEQRLQGSDDEWSAGGLEVDARYLAEIDRLIEAVSHPA